MKTKLMKATVRGSSAALLVSAGVLLLFAAGIQGSGPAPDGTGGIQCSNGTLPGHLRASNAWHTPRSAAARRHRGRDWGRHSHV